jgi:DNA-directed RNA polymerase specialized sigma24 family protein
MTEAPSGARTAATIRAADRLDLLVERIAGGDRTAFRCLYSFLVMLVWREAIRALGNPTDARAVTRSTFVEVWHLAGQHLDHGRHGARTWIAAIAARLADDRRSGPEPHVSYAFLDQYDQHVHLELAALLGTGPALMRLRPGSFARVDNLDIDLADC